MAQVIEEKITNIKVRKSFCNVNTIDQIICEHQLKFIGKLMRMSETSTPKELLIAANIEKQSVGRPASTTRTSMLKN